MNVTFLFLMFSFYSCFTKKVDEYNFTSIFMFSSGRQFFSSRFSFFTSSYNFEVNLHEKVGQKIEKACRAIYGEGKMVRKEKFQKNWNFLYEYVRKEKSSFFGIIFTSQFFPTPYLECRLFP